ncbi:hypothetical protein Ocin01_12310 [Orchesella cincta]|uniref:Uncharacterized protein n=1 Tax=Orchesella cincta TaxID=48709 RepID=A0A1D2MMV9_ORCCI|nr:hypothetical protein Ocin01_12310 [Orchesella cincta]
MKIFILRILVRKEEKVNTEVTGRGGKLHASRKA